MVQIIHEVESSGKRSFSDLVHFFVISNPHTYVAVALGMIQAYGEVHEHFI